MYLTIRENKILILLLDSRHISSSIKDISEKLEVSERTIQRELKNVETTIKKFNLALDRSKGVRIIGELKDIENLRRVLNKVHNFGFSQEDRFLIILYKLLANPYPSKVSNLSKELSVSNTTLTQDLVYLEKMIENLPLKLIRKKGHGLELVGEEKDLRLSLLNFLSCKIEESPFFAIEDNIHGMPPDHGGYLGIIDRDFMYSIGETFEKAERLLLFKPTENAKLRTLLYLFIAAVRIGLGKYIPDETLIEDTDIPEHNASIMLFTHISSLVHVKIPQEEINFLTRYLLGTQGARTYDICEPTDMNTLAIELIDHISKRTGYQYKTNKEFIDGLVSHLEPLFYRAKNRLLVYNPFIEDIKKEYYLLFYALKGIMKYKFPELLLSDDEVGFLTIHFASTIPSLKKTPKIRTLVICFNGIGVSRLLSNRLLDYFPQLSIIQKSSVKDLAQLQLEEFDIIISTVGIYDANFEYLRVSPMLTKNDIKNIEAAINRKLYSFPKPSEADDSEVRTNMIERVESVNLLNNTASEILKNFALHIISYTKFDDVLSFIEKDIYDSLAVEKGILHDLLLKKEHKVGSGVPNTNLMFLHSRSSHFSKTVFRIYRNDQDIRVRGMDMELQNVNVFLFLISTEKLNRYQLDIIGSISLGLLDTNVIDTFAKASSGRIYNLLDSLLSLRYNEILAEIIK